MMRTKGLVTMALGVSLALVMLQVSWASPPASGGPKYNCLNPRGIQPTIEVSGLAPRLATIEGKTIYVNMGEADPVVFPALYDRLRADYPGTTWKWIGTSSFGPSAPEAEVLADADAVIRGVAW